MKYFVLFILLGFYCKINAQTNPNDYTFSTTNTASLYTLTNDNILLGPNEDNQESDAHLMPFMFGAMGSFYNTFGVRADGAVILAPKGFYTVLKPFCVEGSLNKNWDASGMGTSSTGAVRSQVFGERPYRKFVISFENMSFKKSSGAVNGSFQVVLHESSGKIEYIYGSMIVTDSLIRVGSPSLSNFATNKHAIVNYSAHTVIPGSSLSSYRMVPGPITGLHSPTEGSRRSYMFTPNSIEPLVDTSLVFGVFTSGLASFTLPEQEYNSKYLFTTSYNRGGPFAELQEINSNIFNKSVDSAVYYRIYKSNGNAITPNYASGLPTFGLPRKFISKKSGSWIDNTTWGSAANFLPIWGDTVIVSAGDTVNLDGFQNSFMAQYIQVAGVLDFHSYGKLLSANYINVSAGGLIKANNQTTSFSPTNISGSSIKVYRDIVGDGHIDMRYPQSVLTMGGNGTEDSHISVNFLKSNDSLPLLSTLQIQSFGKVILTKPLTINARIDGDLGTLVTNGLLSLNVKTTVGSMTAPSTMVINRFGREPLFEGSVTHNPGNTLKLSYYSFPNNLLRWTYVPTAFIAGAEVPDNGSINELKITTHKGVIANSNWVVTDKLILTSGNLIAGTHDFTLKGFDFDYYGGGIQTTGWVNRSFYNYPYTGGMEDPGSIDRFFPIKSGTNKRFAYLHGAVAGDGTYGVKHTDITGFTLFSTAITEDTTSYVARTNSYWEVSQPIGSSLTNNAFHFRGSGFPEIINHKLTTICFDNTAAPGTRLATTGGKVDPMASRTGITSANILNKKMYIGLGAGSALPLQELEIVAVCKDGFAEITWTSKLDNVAGYELQKSSNGKDFTALVKVNPHSATQYYYEDNELNPDRNMYRVKAIFHSGFSIYSDITQSGCRPGLSQCVLYPNPVSEMLYLKFINSNKTENISLKIIDNLGRIVIATRINTMAQKIVNSHINVSTLPAGNYFVTITDNQGLIIHRDKVIIKK
jgi:hypothetical protein